MKRLLQALVFFLPVVLHAQGILDVRLPGSETGKNISTWLDSVERSKSARFYYKREWLNDFLFTDSTSGKTLRDVLTDILEPAGLSIVEMYPTSIVIVKDPTLMLLRHQAIGEARRDQRRIIRKKFGSEDNVRRKKFVTIHGKITDSKNDDPMAGAEITMSDPSISTFSNQDGTFRLTMRPGNYVMSVGFVNYDETVIDLSAFDDGQLDIALEEVPTLLDEVVVKDQAEREVTTSRIGQMQISMADIKRAPSMLGETDLVKQIQALPGVTTVGEAAAGFNVRGGGVDQNLILYDGMPVFNSAHAFGFLSSFNSQAIRDVSFYRGGIPAEFGGRVSSVLDIRAKEGNMDEWGGNAGIGMITGNVMFNGPIKRNKTSVLGALRSTYSDWLVHSIRSTYADLKNSHVGFYDGTLKLTHLITPDSKLSVTGYASKDEFRLFGDSTYQWFNRLASARFDHRFSPAFSFDATAGISSYSYKVVNKQPDTGFELGYALNTTSFKAVFNYLEGRHKLNFGTQVQYFTFNHVSLVKNSEDAEEVRMPFQRSWENALFVNDVFTLSERITLEGGFRVPMFSSAYGNRVNYVGYEPRASVRLAPNEKSSFKIGYNRMYQFLHLISNTAAVTPVDVWQPSNSSFKPQVGTQISAGYFRNFKEKKYEASIEGFHKTINNILDFRDGAKLILNENLDNDLLTGTARAYGVETMVGILSGRLTGNLNYTYSRSLRTVAGETDETSVNSGREYASNFDQPHVVNLSWRYSITRRYHFTGNFTYHTGRPVSIPLGAYHYEDMVISDFSDRNQFRIPHYHRLDLAFVIEGNHKRKKLGDGTWVISVYNVYARKNAYSVFYKMSDIGLMQPYRLAIVGTALPSITYNFTF